MQGETDDVKPRACTPRRYAKNQEGEHQSIRNVGRSAHAMRERADDAAQDAGDDGDDSAQHGAEPMRPRQN